MAGALQPNWWDLPRVWTDDDRMGHLLRILPPCCLQNLASHVGKRSLEKGQEWNNRGVLASGSRHWKTCARCLQDLALHVGERCPESGQQGNCRGILASGSRH